MEHEQAPAATTAETEEFKQRKIRSFVLRQGHLSTGQARALEELGPQFCIDYSPNLLDLDAAFGRRAPRVLEIGFGMGTATAEIAAQRPDTDFLGVEVHTPGVGSLLKLIGEQSLTNLRIVQHDAVEVLENMLQPDSLAGVHIFFPDPWHKSRHNKRRLIKPEFVQQLVTRIQSGGYLHLATDWEDYAVQMLTVLSAEPSLVNTVTGSEGYAERPDYRPLTKFENRGIKLGHGVWDLVFQKK
ncbi:MULTISPECIES: tRNA (guanosine(46)-N7)-methyltransferase TrmB [Deefgea]|uniref:tRNA (guanine-N(7)-)-methyltransferase n=1 Tax=Deefgea chitinilytica TaxID=570276 RepID=A0ABS2CBG4_9NEIS|nr:MULTISPECIES: tRNA (guanosine(46)-N7)-methyltransferase TrmB [Deefgea]MBM5571488.1 tRNA (guanosine(46)-N7)-methyltransferase TrmB [Deefgea chitinilytica]MBM9888721.1 tRNA (guanosine(46)-N7)-methyltransferase TrmB [Deefgea sp. CFH1-16]